MTCKKTYAVGIAQVLSGSQLATFEANNSEGGKNLQEGKWLNAFIDLMAHCDRKLFEQKGGVLMPYLEVQNTEIVE